MSKDFSVTAAHTESPTGTLVKKYKITIGGESYFLVSDEPEERIRAVAQMVDNQMRTITYQGHSDDPKRVAVLVALQCASRMLALQELLENYHAQTDVLVEKLTQELMLLQPPESL